MTIGDIAEVCASYKGVDGRQSLADQLEYALVDTHISRMLTNLKAARNHGRQT